MWATASAAAMPKNPRGIIEGHVDRGRLTANSFADDWLDISDLRSIAGKCGVGGGLPLCCQGRSEEDEGRPRQSGGVCFGTCVPGMGR